MKKIKWIFIGLVLLISINNIDAIEIYSHDEGGLSCTSSCFFRLNPDSYSSDDPVTYIAYESFTLYRPDGYSHAAVNIHFQSANTTPDNFLTYAYYEYYIEEPETSETHSAIYIKKIDAGWDDGQLAKIETSGFHSGSAKITLVVTTDVYNLTGYVNCVDNMTVQINNSGTWCEVYYNDTNQLYHSYDIPIALDGEYRILIDGTIVYQFTCSGNETYNYDACNYCTINIYDNCANLLNGAYTVIYDIDKNMDIVYSGYDNPINLLDTTVNTSDELRVIWSTWLGEVQKTCYAQFDHNINLYDPLVYWNMDVYVYDNESNPIENTNVDFNQDCVINGYPARNKYTDSDGLAEFTQCENKDANLVVSKDGYQTLSTTISGGWYDAYTSTYEISIVLQENTTSTWDLINNSINDTNATEEPEDIPDVNDSPINVHLYFKDVNGNYVTQINDSDPYVRCYYDVIAMKPVSMTLSFQSSLSGYWFTDVYIYPYTIDNNSYGYMNLSNDNFSDPDYIYRAYIRDPSYPEYDRYVYLSVVNQTEQSETHYENLTALCMFANTNKNGSIDYREEIKGYAYVVSDNASLRTVSLELYDNSTLIDYVNLTNSSFDEYDLYEWELGYNYTLGHNYSLVLKSSNNSILYCDNVIAYNLVGNKLTIKVTDSFNHDLDHVYVYVEHYGSINTGWLNYGTFERLPNGETRYKATKSGYRSGVWKTVNLTDENEVVTYQLIQEAPEGSIASVRMSDNDVKDIYYPFMYFLFIIILIGALMNVIN